MRLPTVLPQALLDARHRTTKRLGTLGNREVGAPGREVDVVACPRSPQVRSSRIFAPPDFDAPFASYLLAVDVFTPTIAAMSAMLWPASRRRVISARRRSLSSATA